MSTERRRRIGVTMRTDSPAEYSEPRDGLARDWAEFLAFAAPECLWVPVPNLGERVVDLARELELDGVVLSGGADLGVDPLRDESELALLEHAAHRAIPVLGVCRGLQVLLRFHGAEALERIPGDAHVATTHPVTLLDAFRAPGEGRITVNSYHRNAVRADRLPAGCLATAVCEEGWVEAVRFRQAPMCGVMWHPERGRPFREVDRRIFRRALKL